MVNPMRPLLDLKLAYVISIESETLSVSDVGRRKQKHKSSGDLLSAIPRCPMNGNSHVIGGRGDHKMQKEISLVLPICRRVGMVSSSMCVHDIVAIDQQRQQRPIQQKTIFCYFSAYRDPWLWESKNRPLLLRHLLADGLDFLIFRRSGAACH